jgi:outer membrane protein assembly factor BamE (lipoprotein component of BamABCDE complex)
LLLSLLLAGCGGPGVTLDNYNRIEKGMTMAQVKAILGTPRSSMYREGNGGMEDARPGESQPKPGRHYVWQWYTQHKYMESLDIIVEFDDDKVVSKEESRSKIDPR